MAFLDNSGDIILDAVLTDTGRLRLAKGDGSFRITQFAFGDDEINYGLYNKNNPSGSAYYDLEILQTPVLEAFTNNTSVLKYQLISNNRTDLLFLPVAKLNTEKNKFPVGFSSYFVVSNDATYTAVASVLQGIVDGINDPTNNGSIKIEIDQGLDSNQAPNRNQNLEDLDRTLYESQYSIELNYNLLRLRIGNQLLEPTSIDDDGFAVYVLDQNINDTAITKLKPFNTNNVNEDNTILNGTVGSRLSFNLLCSTQVQIGTEIFTRLGGQFDASSIGQLSLTTYYIDTAVTVRGLTTGVSTTVPLKIVKNS
jgi:hypothetical protein